jgi:hypothetical protein
MCWQLVTMGTGLLLFSSWGGVERELTTVGLKVGVAFAGSCRWEISNRGQQTRRSFYEQTKIGDRLFSLQGNASTDFRSGRSARLDGREECGW